jgi:signal transduction histidine kinase/CheY-like chemotaxis protein
MGDFSTAFNKMVLQLEDSLEEMKNRETNERMQIMFDATPLCCSFFNENFQMLDCNLEAVKLYNLKNKQEYIDRFFDLMPERQSDGQLSAEVAHKRISEAFEYGYTRCEFLHQKLDGEPMPTEVTLVRVLQGDCYIVVSYARDLREIKKQRAALDQERLLLLDVINSSPICFAILVDGKVKFSSAFMNHFLGLDIDEPLSDCFVNQEKGAHLLAEVKKNVHVEWEPVTLRSKEGKTKEMLANLFPTNYYGESGTIVWLVDITELKEIEADLRTAKETAEHLGRVKDEFIANISHELRTPMNAVLGILHLLHGTNLSVEQTSHISTMETSAKHLLQIINDILDFSQFESGKVFIGSEDFDVRTIFEHVRSLFHDAAEEKQLLLSCSVDSEVPPLITGDPLRVQQILVNLTDNAIKFTESGSVQLRVQLESMEEEKAILWFSVQDTGVGMDAEAMDQAFRSFSQADTSVTRQYGGVGLGLTIAKKLVEMMEGRIWCDSEPQKGTTFFFTAVFNVPQEENTKDVVFPESFQGLPILLVEDNKVNQIVATQILRAKGFQVEAAANGLLGVEMVKQKEYALVLMDMQMPVMDGIQATRKIRSEAKYESLPIIALTANAMEDDRRQCLEAGMNDFIAKPIKPEILYRAILKWAKKGE